MSRLLIDCLPVTSCVSVIVLNVICSMFISFTVEMIQFICLRQY